MYFGIGWHKTATTSLTEAFNILGLKARHHPYEMYAEHAEGARTFKAFEDNDFVCDAIIHVLFREMDKQYPDSKFILTTRPAQGWLSSVQQHFANGHAVREDLGGASSWDLNNEARHVHAIHEMMYGRRTFDAETMAQRYKAHNADVLEHFKDRPEDFLVMDIEDAQSFNWERLCAFIGEPVPAHVFPHLRKAADSRQHFSFGKPERPAFIAQ
jgi:hypothetical protein